MRRPHFLRQLVSMAVIISACATSACSNPVALPSQGPVRSFASVEQRSGRVFTSPQGPENDAQPETIVKELFDAMPAGVQNDGFTVARQFLTRDAARSWNGDEAATVYEGRADFVRKNAGMRDDNADNSIIIEVTLPVIGVLDAHGVFSAQRSDNVQLSFTLAKQDGQWRVARIPAGVFIAQSDFEQVYREVSLYQLDKAGKGLIPDVRWLSWRNWRAHAVRELLGGTVSWLNGAAKSIDNFGSALTVGAVSVKDNVIQVHLSTAFERLDQASRALLVRQIRLTLGDGNLDYTVEIETENGRFANEDVKVDLTTTQPSPAMYSLSSGHIVSLGSSSALRVAETKGFSDAHGFVYETNSGGRSGAVLRSDGVAECVDASGTSCGVMFSGTRLMFITAGLDGEVWAVRADGRTLLVSSHGRFAEVKIPWLGSNRMTAVALSSEGSRIALAISSGSEQGVVLSAVIRDHEGRVTALGSATQQISRQQHVQMLTFYNDITLVYATYAGDGSKQKAFRQIAPGSEQRQRLPDEPVIQMSAGQISMYRRLTVLDTAGNVRTVTGSLEGSWSIADTQVTAISDR